MISPTSRYNRNSVVALARPDGSVRTTILHNPPTPATAAVTYYTWGEADRTDLVAYAFLGDERSWWLIADVNPEIADWTWIAPGTVIRIPHVA
jgi:hypothetical protein